MRLKICTYFTVLLCGAAVVTSCNSCGRKDEKGAAVVEWKIAELPGIISVEGEPQKVMTALGEAVYFDGVDDAYFVGVNPLDSLEQFTIEFVFKPVGDAPFAQRFMHLGGSGPRVLFETRVTPENKWYFDAHTSVEGGGKLTLIDEGLLHDTDKWYHVAIVWYKDGAVSYVNGVEQRRGELDFIPIKGGISSIGVRQNRVDWFKGYMYKIRVTAAPLKPSDFIRDHERLNVAEN